MDEVLGIIQDRISNLSSALTVLTSTEANTYLLVQELNFLQELIEKLKKL